MKYTLTLAQNLPFASAPRFVELDAEHILTNDVILPGENHCYNMRLWCIGNEHGALGAVWATNEQDALDELCDAGLAAGLAIEEEDADEETARLGNAGEPHDLTHAWMAVVELEPERDFRLCVHLAEARGACAENLDKI